MLVAAARGVMDKMKEALKNNANVNVKEQDFVSDSLI